VRARPPPRAWRSRPERKPMRFPKAGCLSTSTKGTAAMASAIRTVEGSGSCFADAEKPGQTQNIGQLGEFRRFENRPGRS